MKYKPTNQLRVLYALQGTGNGHINRAIDLIPQLRKFVQVDILISGSHSEIKLPWPVQYTMKGFGFYFGNNGGIDFSRTLKNGSFIQLLTEIHQLPIEQYDFVINDFEPISAWACKMKGVPCVGVSHQGAVINGNSPKPLYEDVLGNFIINHYAPTNYDFGFHFQSYDKNIFTPVIRREIRDLTPMNLGHITVYLPAYSTKLIAEMIEQCDTSNLQWHVFSKSATTETTTGRITVLPIDARKFSQSMAGAEGVVCGAGFETPAEALFLGKKLLVIPMKNQYEQQCNAEALRRMGVAVIKKLDKQFYPIIQQWILAGKAIEIAYPNQNEEVMELAIAKALAIKDAKLRKTETFLPINLKDLRKPMSEMIN